MGYIKDGQRRKSHEIAHDSGDRKGQIEEDQQYTTSLRQSSYAEEDWLDGR